MVITSGYLKFSLLVSALFAAASPDLWVQGELSLYERLTFSPAVYWLHCRHLSECRFQSRKVSSHGSSEPGLQGHAGADRAAEVVCRSGGHPDQQLAGLLPQGER